MFCLTDNVNSTTIHVTTGTKYVPVSLIKKNPKIRKHN